MKVFTTPEQVPAPQIDFGNFDPKAEEAKEAEHAAKLKDWLLAAGYDGERTGEILREPHADGYAQYMLGHKGRQSCLIHLPYGDAWHSRNVEHLPLKEILSRIDRANGIAALFRSAVADRRAEEDGDAPAPRM